jgi:hypothetical protein
VLPSINAVIFAAQNDKNYTWEINKVVAGGDGSTVWMPGDDATLSVWSARPMMRDPDPLAHPIQAVPAEQRLRWWACRPHPWWGYEPQWASRADEAGWWWLGVHGGAGVSTLETCLPGGVDAHRAWPNPAIVGPSLVVLVARTHVAGMTRAAWALRQAAVGDVPAGVQVAGVVTVADSPNGFARPQDEALRRLRGLAPHLWLVPWIDEFRLVTHAGELGAPHPAITRLFHDLTTLADTAPELSAPHAPPNDPGIPPVTRHGATSTHTPRGTDVGLDDCCAPDR